LADGSLATFGTGASLGPADSSWAQHVAVCVVQAEPRASHVAVATMRLCGPVRGRWSTKRHPLWSSMVCISARL
jgi:hypothetical protein